MNKTLPRLKALLFWSALFSIQAACAATTDTLHVLSYNILYMGDTPPCQGAHGIWEGYLASVIFYTNPDIVGFEKMEAEGAYGTAPAGFQDSLLQCTFNVAYPGRYAYCPFTNVSGADNICELFYNQQKLGYAGILCTYSNITDFTTYRLYYKSATLAATHDTIFLYVTLNHTNSGSSSSDASTRAAQIEGEMAAIETHFTTLPNMINMGDFNVHNSSEACYQTLVAPASSHYQYYDPVFYPDLTYAYPADWDNNPADYAPCLSVSTRTGSLPNTCSNDNGGGKSWYDHIFLSASIINNADHISYLPHSFRITGNDGNRVGNPANSSPANTSVPASVIDAIYEISEHYPVTLDLLVNSTASSVAGITALDENITVANPIAQNIEVQLPENLAGKDILLTATDVAGKVQMKGAIPSAGQSVQIPCTLAPGAYYFTFTANGKIVGRMPVIKK